MLLVNILENIAEKEDNNLRLRNEEFQIEDYVATFNARRHIVYWEK